MATCAARYREDEARNCPNGKRVFGGPCGIEGGKEVCEGEGGKTKRQPKVGDVQASQQRIAPSRMAAPSESREKRTVRRHQKHREGQPGQIKTCRNQTDDQSEKSALAGAWSEFYGWACPSDAVEPALRERRNHARADKGEQDGKAQQQDPRQGDAARDVTGFCEEEKPDLETCQGQQADNKAKFGVSFCSQQPARHEPRQQEYIGDV
nr:hypothetical protein [uncultured Shimia sp.]